MTRRDALTRTLLAFASPSLTRGLAWGYDDDRLRARLAELDKRCGGGRLGCAVLNTSTGAVIAHSGDERFPMCSTFKASALAFVLQRANRRAERLDRRKSFRDIWQIIAGNSAWTPSRARLHERPWRYSASGRSLKV